MNRWLILKSLTSVPTMALSGGTSVTISGNGFEGDVEVSFGNLALDITVIDAQTILFSTPSSPSEAQIDVTVRSDIGEVTIDNGFTYTNAAPEKPIQTWILKILAHHKIRVVAGIQHWINGWFSRNVAQSIRVPDLFSTRFSTANH